MIANYHTHTPRCNHARGSEEEYIREGLKAGLQVLGFADHTPYIFPEGYYSRFRMRPEQLAEYCDTILRLRQKYAGRLEMPLGLETEYYPKHFTDLMALLRDHPIDYLILGQHFVGNEYDSQYSGLVTDDKDVVRAYCRQSMEAMNTGLFTYFAHPDLIHYRDDWKFYMTEVRQLCREAKGCGIPLEINLLGIREGRQYPNRLFWEVAAEEGCTAILGSDAHDPKSLSDTRAVREAMAMAKELGIPVIETAKLRPIR